MLSNKTQEVNRPTRFHSNRTFQNQRVIWVTRFRFPWKLKSSYWISVKQDRFTLAPSTPFPPPTKDKGVCLFYSRIWSHIWRTPRNGLVSNVAMSLRRQGRLGGGRGSYKSPRLSQLEDSVTPWGLFRASHPHLLLFLGSWTPALPPISGITL